MPNAQAAIVVVMLALSAATWWLWWRRCRQFGELWPGDSAPPAAINTAALLLTLAYVWLSLLAVLVPDGHEPVTTISLNAVQWGCATRLVMAGLLWGLLRFGAPSQSPRGGDDQGWRRQVGDGVETALASFLPVLALLLLTAWWRQPAEKNLLLRLLEQDDRLATLAWVLAAAAVCAPIFEELLFRVILLNWLKSKVGSTHAIGVSSLAFALVHGPLDGAALLPLAMLLGILYDRRQQYLSVVVAHAFFNLWNVALTMASR